MTAHRAEPGNATDRRRVARVRENGRKEDIVNAAERLFSQDSYAAVSIRDIATAAGVNSALIRYHFGTKEDLYRRLFERRYHLITFWPR
jgi:TetR/AcrR family transcriptional regulator